MADAFISYAREDKAFVQRLHQALVARGRDAWVDWKDIEFTADWWATIQAGIEEADAFVFVISPARGNREPTGRLADFRCLLFHPWSTLETIQADLKFLGQVLPHVLTPSPSTR
jgi:hypothetical protein